MNNLFLFFSNFLVKIVL